jgi:hypothetical protein
MRPNQISAEFSKHRGQIFRLRVLNSRFRSLWSDYIDILEELESQCSTKKGRDALRDLKISLEQEIEEILN